MKFPHTWTIRKTILACAVVGYIGVCQPSTAENREYQIKAAFLLKFAAYVEWPTAESDGDGVFTVGVVGDDSVEDALATMEQKSINGRAIVVTRIRSIADPDVAHCQMLFVSATAEPELAAAFATLGNPNVLTIGETNGFAERGGMIEFRKTKNKLNFAINHEAARQAELRVSVQLLDLAEDIY